MGKTYKGKDKLKQKIEAAKRKIARKAKRRDAVTAAIAACVLAICGCVSEYTGSVTVVGEQLALPEISDTADATSIRVYESIKGARVYTARDSAVKITYSNTYTNTYFGVMHTQDAMSLSVEVEPLETSPQTK